MGSNRGPNKQERLAQYVKDIVNSKHKSSFDFQSSTGAKIRGDLGIEKGNQFIKVVREASE